LGIIIGKGGFGIPKEKEWDHVWGACVINDASICFKSRADSSRRGSAVPTLIETCSMGITLQPGDVIATGTPSGACLSNGVFLKPGDNIDITITVLGALSNTVVDAKQPPPGCAPVHPSDGIAVWSPDAKLVKVPSGQLYVEVTGQNSDSALTIIFIHGLGGNSANYAPLSAASEVEKRYRVVTFDLERARVEPFVG